MRPKPCISLDTNIFIFGLREINLPAVRVLDHLGYFSVKLAYQVEVELRRNLTAEEMKDFYQRVRFFSIQRSYGLPDALSVAWAGQQGLKKAMR